MVEKIAPATRSRMMASIKGKNTAPERAVRRMLHTLGFRFRIHRRDLPGKPDIVLPRHRLAILVHGCFWHRHPGCRFATTPKTNAPFWQAKFQNNIRRDMEALGQLDEAGWRTLVVWECSVKADAQGKSGLPRLLQQAIASQKRHLQIPKAIPRRRNTRSKN
ncbi:very short patch repair endonuclease [Bradyrhizobium sp. 1(2017)]|uniref:very short patch repair endonuclease n=1 Tax=Bradyrhizobium sp. 1(2017) TaxID=1404888 RepID=UPI00140EEA88|nr:DNA mismatch endonuclease Vsr [Bradyrhizobium sp. 1(2017)]QIO36952.1 DNA mismatch endonuclease Vsr [Bradyrhizobium sp. 1(2017)]